MLLTSNMLKVFYFLIIQITNASGWTLVFKVATGGYGNAYNLYTTTGTLNVGDADAQNLRQPFRKHFKSDVIDNWKSRSIVQVRVGVYKHCSEVAYFLFDGTGSDKTNWFSHSRLLESSYTDILPPATAATFSIKGFTYRRFLMTAAWGACPGDIYWLSVVDTDSTDYCDYEQRHNAYRPAVLYSPRLSRSNFTADKECILAESLAVFVKFSTDAITTDTTSDLARCDLVNNETTTAGLLNNVITTSCSFNNEITTLSAMNNGITTSNLVNNGITTSNLVNNGITTSNLVNNGITTSGLVSTTMYASNITNAYCICEFCPNVYITEAELLKMIATLKKKLTIDKKNTSRYKSLHRSAYDDRISAKAIGAVGISVIIGVPALFVAIDIANFQRHIAINRSVKIN